MHSLWKITEQDKFEGSNLNKLDVSPAQMPCLHPEPQLDFLPLAGMSFDACPFPCGSVLCRHFSRVFGTQSHLQESPVLSQALWGAGSVLDVANVRDLADFRYSLTPVLLICHFAIIKHTADQRPQLTPDCVTCFTLYFDFASFFPSRVLFLYPVPLPQTTQWLSWYPTFVITRVSLSCQVFLPLSSQCS